MVWYSKNCLLQMAYLAAAVVVVVVVVVVIVVVIVVVVVDDVECCRCHPVAHARTHA